MSGGKKYIRERVVNLQKRVRDMEAFSKKRVRDMVVYGKKCVQEGEGTKKAAAPPPLRTFSGTARQQKMFIFRNIVCHFWSLSYLLSYHLLLVYTILSTRRRMAIFIHFYDGYPLQ